MPADTVIGYHHSKQRHHTYREKRSMSESLGSLLAELALAFRPFIAAASFWWTVVAACLSIILLLVLIPLGRLVNRKTYGETLWVGSESMPAFEEKPQR